MTGVSGAAASSCATDALDAADPLDAVADHLPGVALAALLDSTDVTASDDHDLVEMIAAWERVAAWAASRQLAAMAELARRPARVQVAGQDVAAVRAEYAPPGRWVREFAADELAARLRISTLAAGARIGLGCDLHRLPATRTSLEAGRIDTARARLIAAETSPLDAETAQRVESSVIERAERLSPSRLRTPLRKAVIAADPAAAAQRTERARADRRVVITPAADGMADLWAHLPATDAIAVGAAISAAARASKAAGLPGDDRTMDQRGADAFVAPFLTALESGTLSTPQGATRFARHRGRTVELQVTVAAATLLGLDEAPAYLSGYGPITADIARELAPDARWRRILTDPRSGTVLDVGTTTYAPPADLARHVETRSPTCTHPTCMRTAQACDLDHTVAFPTGSTSAANLGPRCRRHHRFKHSPGVTVSQDVDGTTRWTMPTGHQYAVPPPEIGPVTSPPTEPDQRPPPTS